MNAPPFLFSAGPWGQAPPPPPQPLPLNPNFLIQSSLNLYNYLSSLASFTPHYRPTPPPYNNFPIQNPNFAPSHHFSVSECHPPPPPHPLQNQKQLLERVVRVVEKARSDLIAAGEGVSAWKVTQAAIRILELDSWSNLGFSMQHVPSLHRLMLTEGKINAFIHCFVGVRRITSLYDLEVAICKNEGIEQFKELGLGPLLRNPLVVHYFSVKCDATEVFKITSEEIISLLSEFMDTCKHTYIRVEEFIDFVVKKCTVASREDLGIRIHSLGMHISAIRVARDLESAALKKSGELIIQEPESRCTKGPPRMQQDKHYTTSIHKQFCGKHIRFDSDDDGSDDENNDYLIINQVNVSSQSAGISDRLESEDGLVISPSQSKGPLSQVNLSSQSAVSSDRVNSDDGLVGSPLQVKGFCTNSCRVGSFSSVCNSKHNRFDSECSDDDEDCNSDQVTCSLANFSQSDGRSDRVSNCPYPSAMEEIQRLGLDRLSSDSGSLKHKETIDSVKKKRKSEDLAIAIYMPPKLGKTETIENESGDDDLYDEEDSDCDQATCNLVNFSSQSGGRSGRVSSCPYPSAMEEIQRLGLDRLSSDSGSLKHKENIDSVKKKRKSEDLAIAIYVPPKLRKTESSENEGGDDDLYDEEDSDRDQVKCSLVNFSSQSGGRSDCVSSCLYPSAREEIQRLGLDRLSSESGSLKHKETIDSVKKKRKSEDLAIAIYVPPELRTEKVEQITLPIENGMQANNVRNLDRNKVESWPPVDWRTAPRYDYACANGFRTPSPILKPRSDLQNKRDDNHNRFVKQADKLIPITDTQCDPSNFGKRDRLSTCTPDAIQAKETGRLGELAAFKYFIDKAGKSAVKWVNEHWETRLPYDLIVDNEGRKEFIEVKATRNPTKDWFEMSVRQLQFAVEQGEAFSIAHVILSANDAATVRIYNNLEKLLMKHNNQELQDQDCKLKSVVMVLEPQKEFTIVSCNSLDGVDLCTLENGLGTDH